MRKSQSTGFSLVELVVVMLMMSVTVLTLGVLLLNNQRAFQKTYDYLHKPIFEDSKRLTTAFGTIARQSNRRNYKIYTVKSDVYTEAKPKTNDRIAHGQAVEFRYWAEPFHENADVDTILEVHNTGTDYALFYLEDGCVKVDYGTVTNGVGAVVDGSRRDQNCRTYVLAENVDTDVNEDLFSHTIVGGAGNGCVNLDVTLTDPDEETIQIVTASFLRADWPR